MLILSVVSFTIMLVLFHYAPIGYEDDNGFHYGEYCPIVQTIEKNTR